jgi:hypothetical protein
MNLDEFAFIDKIGERVLGSMSKKGAQLVGGEVG